MKTKNLLSISLCICMIMCSTLTNFALNENVAQMTTSEQMIEFLDETSKEVFNTTSLSSEKEYEYLESESESELRIENEIIENETEKIDETDAENIEKKENFNETEKIDEIEKLDETENVDKTEKIDETDNIEVKEQSILGVDNIIVDEKVDSEYVEELNNNYENATPSDIYELSDENATETNGRQNDENLENLQIEVATLSIIDIEEVEVSTVSTTKENVMTATISETLFGVDAPWMWWYLTDEGHTIHFSQSEPATGGTPINNNDGVVYTGLIVSDITKAVFDNTINAPTAKYLFNGFNNLTQIEDFSNFNTSSATDMSYMFGGCIKLGSIDLSNLNTSNVTDMYGMFENCQSLENIDLSNFNTENVIDMSAMFSNCYALESIDLSSLNTTNVTNMQYLFDYDISLRSVNLSGLNNTQLLSCSCMFRDCYALSDINLTNFRTPALTDMSYMFYDCTSLVNVDMSSFNTSNVTNMYMLFADCYKLENANLSSFNTANVTDMSEMFLECNTLKNINLSNFDTSNVTDFHSMFSGCISLEELDLSNFNTSEGLDFRWMFNLCRNITTLNISNFDTSHGTNFKQMFAKMKKLNRLDISNVTINNNAIIADLLYGTYNINYLIISNSIANVISKILFYGTWKNTETNNTYTFNSDDGFVTIPSDISGTYELVSADKYMIHWYIEDGNKLHFSKAVPTSSSYSNGQIIDEISIDNKINLPWVISNIVEAYIDDSVAPSHFQWFRNYSNLQIVDVSNLNTSKLTNFSSSFRGCKKITDINFGTMDTSNILYTDYMFANCEELTNIDLSNFNTSNLIETSRMFFKCKKLTSFSFQNWNVNKLKKIDYMFYDCKSLESVDFAGVIFNVNSTHSLFYNCINLQGINLSSFTDIVDYGTMFTNCRNLQNLHCNNNLAKKLRNMGLYGDWQHPESGSIFYSPENTARCNIPNNTTLAGEFTRYNSDDRCEVYYNDSVMPSLIVNSGETIKPRNNVGVNYQYQGTYTDSNYQNEFDFNTPITETIHLYEKIEGFGYGIVTFVTLGGSQVESVRVRDNERCSEPIPPTKENNTFIGWLTNGYDGDDCFNFDTELPYTYFMEASGSTDNIEYFITVLYAKWDDGSTPTPEPTPIEKTLESISIVSKPNKINYKAGNYLDPTGLVIKLNYSDGTDENIAYSDTTKNDFIFTPSLSTSLKVSMNTVTIIYNDKKTSFAISVIKGSGGYVPSDSGGSTGGGGGGGGGGGVGGVQIGNNNLNLSPNTIEIQKVKLESPYIDSSDVMWEFDPLSNNYKLKINMSGQLVPAQNVFVTLNELDIQKGEGMQLARESHNTYYFDDNGNMVTGWVKTSDGKWYFFENEKTINEGRMVKGWKQVTGTWYYFNDDGSMLINAMTPDGYLVNADGKYIS